MFEDKKLTVQLYRRVAACIAVGAASEGESLLGKRLVEMRNSFLNAAKCVEESLEAYAKAESSLPAAAVPEATSLAEAIEGHLSGGTPARLETERPASRVGGRSELDEAALWGK